MEPIRQNRLPPLPDDPPLETKFAAEYRPAFAPSPLADLLMEIERLPNRVKVVLAAALEIRRPCHALGHGALVAKLSDVVFVGVAIWFDVLRARHRVYRPVLDDRDGQMRKSTVAVVHFGAREAARLGLLEFVKLADGVHVRLTDHGETIARLLLVHWKGLIRERQTRVDRRRAKDWAAADEGRLMHRVGDATT